MSPRSSAPAARSRPRPGGAGRPSTCPTARCRCTRRCSARAPRACCPTQDRAAVLWTIDLDADGETTVAVHLERARVRSRAKLDYVGRAARRRRGRPSPSRSRCCRRSASCSSSAAWPAARSACPLPEQEIEADGDGWRLVLRAPRAGRGVQRPDLAADRRARPPASCSTAGSACCARCRRRAPEAIARLRAAAAGPGHRMAGRCDASGRCSPGVDPAQPRGAAFLDHAAELMRGAGYTAVRRRAAGADRARRRRRPRTPT